MGRRSRSNRKKAKTDAGAGSDSSGNRITALPLELRARIASLLPDYRQIVQLSVLSRPWLHIHHHTPVVKINLYEFIHPQDIYFDRKHSAPGLLDEKSSLAVRVALRRLAQEVSASRVDTLRLVYDVDDRRMRRHADRIIALADARDIGIHAGHREGPVPDAWTLDLPAAAPDQLAPAITGPGAAALRKLNLAKVAIRDLPHLPSLRSLSLDSVTVEAPFAPGARCPVLEELDMCNSKIEHARVDIRLPLLRFMDLDEVDVSPHRRSDAPPLGEITIDAPELMELDVTCGAWSTAGYKSFTLRAPKLRFLCWAHQFAERVIIDVGRPGSVNYGAIQLRSIYSREMKYYQEQMMRMLEACSRTCRGRASPASRGLT